MALLVLILPDPRALVPLVLAAVVLVLVNLTMTSVPTTAGPSWVVVRYGVFGLPRFRFAPAAIARAEAVDVPMSRMRGFGVHRSPWRATRLTIGSGRSWSCPVTTADRSRSARRTRKPPPR